MRAKVVGGGQETFWQVICGGYPQWQFGLGVSAEGVGGAVNGMDKASPLRAEEGFLGCFHLKKMDFL